MIRPVVWQLRNRIQRTTRKEEAVHHGKLEVGKRRIHNQMENMRQQTVTEEEFEDVHQYQVPVMADPNTAVESRSATKVTTKRWSREEPKTQEGLSS